MGTIHNSILFIDTSTIGDITLPILAIIASNVSPLVGETDDEAKLGPVVVVAGDCKEGTKIQLRGS